MNTGGFCAGCGAALPARTDVPRPCAACGLSDLRGAKVLVACFVMQGRRLLWMRRAGEPRRGSWAIPAGFLECGETLAEAAARELREETGLVLDPAALRLYSLGSITAINEIYIAFRASVGSVELAPGPEALEARFFAEDELPWEEIAFPLANYAIRQAYADVQRGAFGVYLAQHDAGALVDQS